MAYLLLALCAGFLGRACAEVVAETCSTSWIQEGYVLSSRIARNVEVAQASRVQEQGPLTEELNAKGFSDFTVPISPSVIMMMVAFIALLIAHEAFVAVGMKPLMANHQKPNSLPMQCAFALNWLIMMVSLSMLVPVSLDYALAMNQSATASGVFLSGPTVFALLGTVLGRPLTSEVHWDQVYARNWVAVKEFNFICFIEETCGNHINTYIYIHYGNLN